MNQFLQKYSTLLATMSVVFFSAPSFAAKTFIYCSEGSPSSFNPQLVADAPSNVVANALYNRLVEFEPGASSIVPRLVESWTISQDSLEYTFKLRKDVKFHKTAYFTPKRNLNADDILFSFNRQRSKDHPYHSVSGGGYEYFKSMGMDQTIKDIQKIDDYTVKFTLAKAEASFLANLAMEFSSILSAEYAEKLMNDKTPQLIDVEPVGTGPFLFQKYEKDSIVRFAGHTDYFLGISPLDKLVFVITPDATVRTQKIKTGECHMIAEPAPADYEQFVNDKNLKVTSKAGMNIGFLSFNIKKKPFDNLGVRKAVAHALNRQAYVDALFMGFGVVAKSPLPPTIWGYNDQITDYEYNPKKAKDILREAGYPEGFTTELWALPVARPYNPDGKKMAEMMQADLAQIGIKAKIVTFDWPTYLAKTKNGEHSLGQFGWNSDNGDPDNILYTLLSCDAVDNGTNRSRWCDEKFNHLVTQAKFTQNVIKRTELYKKAQERFKEDLPWVTLAHSKIFRVMSKKVVGYKLDPVARDRFYGVDLKE
jgi:dipeptide transport system substrate-binding protein